MFESAEVGHKLDKAEYEKEVPKLREALLGAQYDLFERGRFQTVALLAGIGGGGRSETANRFNEWMDPRHVFTHAFDRRNDLERERPPAWRYWLALPPRGKLAIFLNAWYYELLALRTAGRIDDGDLHRLLQEIRHFETMLADEGVLLVKIWFHLSREEQRRRLKDLQDDPRTRWRVTEEDLAQLKTYNRYRDVAEQVLRETSTSEAPWMIVEAADARYRDVAAGRILLEALRERLDKPHARVRPVTVAPVASLADNVKLLRDVDLSRRIDPKEYPKQLAKQQERFARLTQRKKFGKRSMVIVFEGHDAAGKGSTIRRITSALDARQYTVVPISSPSDEERGRPYLWRFWRRLPGHGHITIFDRSWYGRVLVERVEGLAPRRRLDARLPGDQRFRGAAAAERHDRREVLAADRQGGAAPALSRPRVDAVQAVQDHARGLAQPQEVGGVRGGRRRHDRPHVDRDRAVDDRRGGGQVVRARQGAADAGADAGGGAVAFPHRPPTGRVSTGPAAGARLVSSMRDTLSRNEKVDLLSWSVWST